MNDELNDSGALPEPGDYEENEARRLADALDVLDTGERPDIDPREDPELASMLGVVTALREPGRAATDSSAFDHYRTRSRALVLQSVAAERPGVAATVRAKVVPFYRQWTVMAPVATAAAALLAVALLLSGGSSSSPTDVAPAQVTSIVPGPVRAVPQGEPETTMPDGNLTPITIERELEQLREAVDGLLAAAAEGDSIDPRLLRAVTEGTAGVALDISAGSEQVTRENVIEYAASAARSHDLLRAVSVEREHAPALAAAVLAAEDGAVVAARYFLANPLEAVSAAPLLGGGGFE